MRIPRHEGEDRDCFNQTLEYRIEKFQPKDEVEQDLIDEMVAAGWRMRRLWWIETELLNMATKAAADPTVSSRLASAFTRLAETNQLHLLPETVAVAPEILQPPNEPEIRPSCVTLPEGRSHPPSTPMDDTILPICTE